jgi:four helix bundle protein
MLQADSAKLILYVQYVNTTTTNRMKNFKNLTVWNKSMSVAKSCLSIINIPKDTKYNALFNQINRSAISIPSNIAEGSSRKSTKEYLRYLEISLGSAFELETQLLLIEHAYVDREKSQAILSELIEVQKMLSGLMSTLKSELRSKQLTAKQ